MSNAIICSDSFCILDRLIGSPALDGVDCRRHAIEYAATGGGFWDGVAAHRLAAIISRYCGVGLRLAAKIRGNTQDR